MENISLTNIPLDSYWLLEPKAEEHYLQTIETVGLQEIMAQYDAYRAGCDDESDNIPYAITGDGVANVKIDGPLTKELSWFSWYFGGTSYNGIINLSQRLKADPLVKAVHTEWDSPGGNVAGLMPAYEALADLASIKPMGATIEDMCCSAAYWLLMAVSDITISAMAQIGNIGVFRTLRDSSKMYQREGITTHLLASGPMKGIGQRGVEITPEQLAHEQSIIDAIAAQFFSLVQSSRSLKEADLDKVRDGSVFLGQKAIDAKLANKLGRREDTLKTLRKQIQTASSPKRFAVSETKETLSMNPLEAIVRFYNWAMGNGTDDDKAAAKKQLEDHQKAAIPGSTSVAQPSNATQPDKVQAEEITSLKSELQALKADSEARAKREEEALWAAYIRQGKFTAANLQKEKDLRAMGPELYDKLFAERPRLGVAPTVDADYLAAEITGAMDERENAKQIEKSYAGLAKSILAQLNQEGGS